MDELWGIDVLPDSDEDAGTPQQLLNFVRGEHRELLARALESAETDSRRLLDHLRDRLISHFQSANRLNAKRAKNSDWACRIEIASRARAENHKGLIEVHLAGTTKSPQQALCLLLVPAKGSPHTRKRALAWLNAQFHSTNGSPPKNWAPPGDLIEHAEFGRAHIVLHRVPLAEHLEGLSLNMVQLANAFMRDVAWLTPERTRELLQVCKPNAH